MTKYLFDKNGVAIHWADVLTLEGKPCPTQVVFETKKEGKPTFTFLGFRTFNGLTEYTNKEIDGSIWKEAEIIEGNPTAPELSRRVKYKEEKS